jgi:hypothetical protein
MARMGKTWSRPAAEPPGSVAARLARDFGEKTAIARRGIQALSRPLCPDAPPELARQTWFLLAVKLLAAETTATVAGRPSVVTRLCRSDGQRALRTEIEALEQGPLLGQLRGNNGDGDSNGGRDPFAWYLDAWSDEIAETIREVAARLASYPPEAIARIPAGGHDLFKPLYQAVFPRTLRHALGEYYTPDWLADHVLDQVGYRAGARLLDPACGSGTFLMAAVRRHRAAGRDRIEESEWRATLARHILDGVVGLELSPLAAMTARANYLLAIADLLPGDAAVEIPVYRCDAILDGPESVGRPQQPFDFVVGNPPWIAWDNLPCPYREATKPLWERYGLFSLSGNQARHGGGKKDLAMLMLYRGADRYLKPLGRLGMVVTQTLFQTKGAGDGFRRFRLGTEGEWLRVDRVDDLVALKPFPGAASHTSTIVLTKGAKTEYPVLYVQWTPGQDGRIEQRRCRASPIDPARPGSPWLVGPADVPGGSGVSMGPSDYVAHLGANSGGANAIYWLRLLSGPPAGPSAFRLPPSAFVSVQNLVEKAKRNVPAVEQAIEPGLVYPLVRWGDVGRWSARPSAHVLLAQDAATRSGIAEPRMRREYPRTYAYLKQFEPILVRRAAYRRYQGRKPFYSMYNVGTYTLAPIKVVWRRMDRWIRAAVVEPIDDPLLGRRPVVPQETCVLIACTSADEAHYLCAMLNSARVNALVCAHSVGGGKGFGTPGMLEYLGLRRFEPGDRRHEALAACSRRAHELVAASAEGAARRELTAEQEEINRLGAEL